MTRAVVLAAGRGTRLRQEGGTPLLPEQEAMAGLGLKALVPVHGQPFLSYLLSNLADAGFSDAVVVVGPATGTIREHYGAHPPERIRLAFGWQAEPRGSADALLAAEAHTGAERFLVLNADNLYPVALLREMREGPGAAFAGYTREGLLAWGNVPAERISAFALATVGDDGCLTSIVEKPDAAILRRLEGRSRISMTCWRLGPAIYDACRSTTPSLRGELELTDAVRIAVARGMCIRLVPTGAGALDLSRRTDVPAVEGWLEGREARP